MVSLRRIAVAATLAFCAAVAGRAASAFEERITALYRPLQAEQVALSPDGEHIYTRHERGELAIYTMAVDRTDRKFKISVEGDRAVAFSRAKAPLRLRLFAVPASAQVCIRVGANLFAMPASAASPEFVPLHFNPNPAISRDVVARLGRAGTGRPSRTGLSRVS